MDVTRQPFVQVALNFEHCCIRQWFVLAVDEVHRGGSQCRYGWSVGLCGHTGVVSSVPLKVCEGVTTSKRWIIKVYVSRHPCVAGGVRYVCLCREGCHTNEAICESKMSANDNA